MKDINLIPRQYFKNKSKPKVLSLYFIIALVIAATLIYSYISPMLYIEKLQAESDAFNGSLVEYNSVVKKIKALENEKAVLDKRLSVLNEIRSKEIKPTEVYDTIKKIMPKDVYLISLEYSAGEFKMDTAAKTAVDAAEFYIELNKIKAFKNIKMSEVAKDQAYYRFYISFSMSTGSDAGASNKNQ